MPIAVLAIVLAGIVGMIMVMIGADHKSFSVHLKWNPPPAVPGVTVAGYNIYRCNQPGGPFEKIASGVSSLKYTDHDVSSGQTYYYLVRTVDAAGRQSPLSTEVSAAIP